MFDIVFNPKENILDEQLAVSGIENQILSLFDGGASARNRAAKKAAKRENKYIDAQYKFEGEELERSYNYAKESQEVQKRNTEKNIAFREAERAQSYDFGMAIRDFQFARENLAYEQSKATYTAQKDFNEVAENFALLQQDRFKFEKETELAFDRKQTLLNYTAVVHGLQLQRKKTKSAAAEEMRQTGIAGLKAKGQALARGQGGRTAAKNIQGIMAEVDAQENALINNLIYDTAQVDFELLQRSQQNLMDKLALDLTGKNLIAADQLSRANIKAQRAQNDLTALSRLALKPDISPPLPEPIALPRPEWQDVYKPRQGPKPPRVSAPQENVGLAILGRVASVGVAAATGGFGAAAGERTTGAVLGGLGELFS